MWDNFLSNSPEAALDPVADHSIADLLGYGKANPRDISPLRSWVTGGLKHHPRCGPFATNGRHTEKFRAFFEPFDAHRHGIRLKGSYGLWSGDLQEPGDRRPLPGGLGIHGGEREQVCSVDMYVSRDFSVDHPRQMREGENKPRCIRFLPC
jgi:hypothetical protein